MIPREKKVFTHVMLGIPEKKFPGWQNYLGNPNGDYEISNNKQRMII